MTPEEWVEVVAVMGGFWPHAPLPEQAVRMQFEIVKDLNKDEVIRVVGEFATRADQRFPPTAGQIAGLLRGGTSQTSLEEAVVLLVEATQRVGRSIYARDFHERHQAAVDWLADRDPVLAAYAARRGLCGPDSFGHEPLSDVEFGGAVRHRISNEIKDVYRAAEDRVSRGLPAVEAHQLVVRSTGVDGDGMSKLLDRLRPAEQIEAGDESDPSE